jgi:hypothetical protein
MKGNKKERTLKEKVQVLQLLQTHGERNAAEVFRISNLCEKYKKAKSRISLLNLQGLS